ncbi:MAG: BON domain-containing protein [Pseudomonadota bacterium]
MTSAHKWIAPILCAILLVAGCATSRNLDSAFSDIGADAELKSVLFSDRSHDYSDVDLTVFEGRLLLTGTVRSPSAHEKLIQNAWSAESIDQVIDEVSVDGRTSIGQGFEDARIDQTLRANLIGRKDVISGDYKIAVSGATVYLIGRAQDEQQLTTALNVARNIAGVEKVVNHVVVNQVVLKQ